MNIILFWPFTFDRVFVSASTFFAGELQEYIRNTEVVRERIENKDKGLACSIFKFVLNIKRVMIWHSTYYYNQTEGASEVLAGCTDLFERYLSQNGPF